MEALGALVGVAAVPSGLLVAGPAQATDGPVSARMYYPNTTGSGGESRAVRSNSTVATR
jgi:hypothetical protein